MGGLRQFGGGGVEVEVRIPLKANLLDIGGAHPGQVPALSSEFAGWGLEAIGNKGVSIKSLLGGFQG